MTLRATLLAALASAACSIAVPSQFSCPEPGKETGCGSGQVCGPNNLCETKVTCAPAELPCNGVCTNITANRENCGACGAACGPSQQCVSGKCQNFCAAGQTACAQTSGGFICENLSNDRTNCGTCGNVCPQGQVCTPATAGSSGHCAVECLPGLTNCSGNCIDVTSDDASCGACGNACGAGQHCVGGHCSIVCTPGQTECPAGSGNCVDTTRDRQNCGGCGVTCPSGQICTGSSCQVSCQTGLTLCGSTCVNTVADANNCGGCGITCAAGQICTNHGPGNTGVCELRCPSGETACGFPAWSASTAYFAGNQVTNGGNLYVATTGGTSAATGGPSGNATAIADGAAVWKFVSLAPASANQCVSLATDRNNCGACDDQGNSKACADGQVCVGGACVVSCAAGLTNCNGTCIDTRNDPTNCGACGTSCAAASSGGPVCVSSACTVSCPAGQVNCGGKCIDPSTDARHCGVDSQCGGGTVCTTGQVCSGGGCVLACPAGSIACNGKCVDPQHDNDNCGACNHLCASGTICSGAQCVGTCGPGLTTCNPGTPSAYCAATSSDAANCNGCGNVCSPSGTGSPGYAHANAYCASGACGAACQGTFADCNNSLADGCETDLSSAAAHCGTCTNACAAADNAAPACANSSCSTSCRAGFGDCDSDPSNGCEADNAHDAANCGGCGLTCSGSTPYCAAGCSATPDGVQENLSLTDVQASWGTPCFAESYSHVGTTLAAIQAACPAGTQVLVACAAPGSSTLLVAAVGPRATAFGGGAAGNVTFYAPGTGVPAYGFSPAAAAAVFTVSSASYAFDVGGSSTDAFAGAAGSQRLSWPMSSGILTTGGRCGDRTGASATSNYQRLVFTK